MLYSFCVAFMRLLFENLQWERGPAFVNPHSPRLRRTRPMADKEGWRLEQIIGLTLRVGHESVVKDKAD
jgi:hypothetical protein